MNAVMPTWKPPCGRPGWFQDRAAGRDVFRYWDGAEWTSHLARRARRSRVPSYRMAALLLAGGLLLVAGAGILGTWGHASIRRECSTQGASNLDACENDRAFGVDMVDAWLILGGAGLVAWGVRDLVLARRRAGQRPPG